MARKVLIAEDSAVIQNITRKVLQFQNFEIVSVKDGVSALNEIKSSDFDVVLMDINMPTMNGMECAKQIRAMEDPNKAGIPIVAITGNAQNFTVDQFKAVGINEYLPKPVDYDQLIDTVNKVITQEVKN
ncbi:response regulator [Algivirga pacifica]|uniref:Response regulatory domain-containing protein n=1 Tax=Algivirga pacifica TaxID=1162670 RepID=A0ABP9DIA5_9BACT